MGYRTAIGLIGLPLLLLSGCFGASIERSYYVLHGVTISNLDGRPIAGHVRVRNMDTASIYEKFQIVVRRSPYELSYSETDVWAVKPNRMVADVIAEALSNSKQFSLVARELGDLRPDYILSGELHAVEVYQSDKDWFAHLALNMQLTRFATGETLLTYKFDERKPVPAATFAQFARAMSELLSTAMDEMHLELQGLEVPRAVVEDGVTRNSGSAHPPSTASDDESAAGTSPEPGADGGEPASAGSEETEAAGGDGVDGAAVPPPETIFVPVHPPPAAGGG